VQAAANRFAYFAHGASTREVKGEVAGHLPALRAVARPSSSPVPGDESARYFGLLQRHHEAPHLEELLPGDQQAQGTASKALRPRSDPLRSPRPLDLQSSCGTVTGAIGDVSGDTPAPRLCGHMSVAGVTS
jgi:hypothetical protein